MKTGQGPIAIDKSHAFVKASFPIYMPLSNSAHSRMGCLHRKRKSPPITWRKKKDFVQKNYPDLDSIYQEFEN